MTGCIESFERGSKGVKQIVHVSEEMLTLVGSGAIPSLACPAEPVVFHFAAFGANSAPRLHYREHCDLSGLDAAPLVLIVSRGACARLFAQRPEGGQSWHLPTNLVALAQSIVECEAEGEARSTLQLARSIELLCQIHAALAQGHLVSTDGECSLTEHDVACIASARRLVDQRWAEKLTIAELSRAAGVNRDKLARGFRDLYGATITEVLSERRLSEARRLLLASDLPVATVAYRCSYLNNAAFTRAFTRRFGLPPSELRRARIAA
jgi:AraC family transcriptional activator of pyochelin receptor